MNFCQEWNVSDKSGHDHGHGASTIRASKRQGGGGNWIVGALAAAVLAGGGYWAYSTYGAPPQQESQFAYDDESYVDDPLRDTTTSEDTITAESASSDEVPAATPAAAEPRRTTTPRRSAASTRPQPVPEATIGITPINATTEDVAQTDELVVTAPQRPIWRRTPTARRLSALYPERALERGREGEARLACVVQEEGVLDCERISETPGGFGSAALRVARTFRHAAVLPDGTDAVGSPVNLRVVFRLAEEERRAGL